MPFVLLHVRRPVVAFGRHAGQQVATIDRGFVSPQGLTDRVGELVGLGSPSLEGLARARQRRPGKRSLRKRAPAGTRERSLPSRATGAGGRSNRAAFRRCSTAGMESRRTRHRPARAILERRTAAHLRRSGSQGGFHRLVGHVTPCGSKGRSQRRRLACDRAGGRREHPHPHPRTGAALSRFHPRNRHLRRIRLAHHIGRATLARERDHQIWPRLSQHRRIARRPGCFA